jgi:hypothetical protein
MKKSILFNVLYLICVLNTKAQYQGKVYENYNYATITNNGDTLRNAFMGGMNCVQVNMADLNKDGKKDAVLYDYVNNIVFTFKNIGQAGEVKYEY